MLVVRAVTLDDVPGLTALYEGLSDEDRYRRFFSFYRPPQAFFEKMATVAERNGFELVATTGPAPGPGSGSGGPSGSGDQGGTSPGQPGDRESDEAPWPIVGEAGYVLLPDGDGELAIAVAHSWRGWLGPYLLDALVSAAAARGVPNLEADVLVTNRPMLALLRSRGCATVEHPDWTEVRVVIGTGGRTPTWPGPHDRPRVLVEVPGARWHAEADAKAAGLQVLACGGPSGRHPHCPALAGHPCPLAAGADAIVMSRPPDQEQWRSLTDAHAGVHPGVPVCVEMAGGWTEEPPGSGRVGGGADRAVMSLVQRVAQGTGVAGGTRTRTLDR